MEHLLLWFRKNKFFRWLVHILDVDVRKSLAELKSPIYIQLSKNTVELFSGSYNVEKEVTDAIRDQLDTGDFNCFIDVGANIGFFTWYVEENWPDIKLIAVEPDKRNCITLLRTAKLRNSRAMILPIALAEHTGYIDFYVDDITGKTGSSVTVYGEATFAEHFFHQKRNSQVVPSITLDRVASCINDRTLIKVDMEGSELFMLNGAKYFIREKKPVLIIEINRNTKDEVLKFFNEINYSCTQISKEGYLDRDYIAAPKDVS